MVGEHDGGQLDAHADIHAVGLGGDIQRLAHALHPLAADCGRRRRCTLSADAPLSVCADGDTVAVALRGRCAW